MKKFIKKILNEPLDHTPRDVEIYTYQFPNGKIYVGYTSHGLDYVDKCNRYFSASPVCQYLNSKEYQNIKPKLEKKITIDVYGDEIYKFLREVLDKYTTDTDKIINVNLGLYGY